MSIVAVLLKISLVLFGALFLALGLVPVRKLTLHLEAGALKNKWNVLSGLIVLFIVGYVFYIFDFLLQEEYVDDLNLIVPIVFFFGAIFVFLVGKLAFQTAKDIKKIAALQHESITDGLMGINNRRYFDQSICNEIKIANRYNLNLSLILLDIDKFKDVNDKHGHLSGDEVLKNLANALINIVRESDILCRYGGEEIAIICPNTSEEDATVLAERLRKIIENSVLCLSFATQEEIKITISAGVSSIQKDYSCEKQKLIEKADAALYKAKQSGRNKVVTA